MINCSIFKIYFSHYHGTVDIDSDGNIDTDVIMNEYHNEHQKKQNDASNSDEVYDHSIITLLMGISIAIMESLPFMTETCMAHSSK